MNEIKNKLNNDKIIELFNDYFIRLDPLINKKYTSEYEFINNAINELPLIKKSVFNLLDDYANISSKSNQSFEKNITTVFEIYHAIQNMHYSIKNLYNLFTSSYLIAINIDNDELSKSYKMETNDSLNKLKLHYVKFSKITEEDDLFIVVKLNEILQDIFKQEHPDLINNDVLKSIAFVRNVFYQYKNTVSLYANFMQTLINELYHLGDNGKQLMFKILELIEEDKDFFLRGSKTNTLSNKYNDLHLLNPPLKRFGLIPNTETMLLNDLLILIFNKTTNSKIDLKQYCKKENACVVVMHHVVYNPVEYNLRRLLNNTAKLDPLNGVNEKIINLFNVIVDLMHDESKSKSKDNKNKDKDNKTTQNEYKWNFKYDIIGDDENATMYYVIETIDNKNYRALNPWVKSDKYNIPKHKINAVLQYLKNNNEPDRVINYHTTSINQAIGNMFLKRPLSLDTIEKNAKDIDTQIMRNDVYLRLIQLIRDKIIESEYKNGKLITSNIQINEVIHDKRISETFSDVVLNLYKIGTRATLAQEMNAGNFPFSEILASYMLELRQIARRFMKELHDGYNRNPLSDDVFEKPVDERTEIIFQKINEILTKTIQLIISDKDNIYNTLNFKYLLLNYQ